MVDYISNVTVAPGVDICRGNKIRTSKVPNSLIHIKEIVADGGFLEIIGAINGNEHDLIRCRVEDCIF
jgi:hypothetical protein